jgi:lysophospholipase L1-like esterase
MRSDPKKLQPFIVQVSRTMALSLAMMFLLSARSETTPQGSQGVFRNNDTVCLIGDSITHSGIYHSYLQLFYVTRFPQMRLKFINCGISGDSASGMLSRLKKDVFSNNATVATLSAGMNDVNRGLYSQVTVPEDAANKKSKAIEDYKQNVEKISDELSKKGIRQIFLTPTIYDENFETSSESMRGVNGALEKCSDFILEFAKSHHAPSVDLWHPMEEVNRTHQQNDKQFTLIGKDRIHPGAVGHLVMAYLFLNQTKAPSDVWRLDLDAKSGHVISETNCEASDITPTVEGVVFKNKELALPFPEIEDARQAYELVPFVERLNQQVLQIRNLSEGSYTLKINGLEIGNYPQSALQQGINLAVSPTTPQMARSQEIAKLCKEQHSLGSTIRTLRRVEIKHLNGVDLGNKEAVKSSLEAFIADKQAHKNDPAANSGYYIKTAQTYLKEIGNESAILERMNAIDQEIYRINQPKTYSYAIEKQKSPTAPVK